jgi:hypothetical protein
LAGTLSRKCLRRSAILRLIRHRQSSTTLASPAVCAERDAVILCDQGLVDMFGCGLIRNVRVVGRVYLP